MTLTSGNIAIEWRALPDYYVDDSLIFRLKTSSFHAPDGLIHLMCDLMT